MLPPYRLFPVVLVLTSACQSSHEISPQVPAESDSPAPAADPLSAAPDVAASPQEAAFLLDSLNGLVAPEPASVPEPVPEPVSDPEPAAMPAPIPAATPALDLSPAGILKRTLGRFFQADLDHSKLNRTEALESLSAFELADSRDGRLDQREFRAAYESHRIAIPGDEKREVQKLMRGRDPWLILVGGLDQDGDAAVSAAELGDFFDTLGGDPISF